MSGSAGHRIPLLFAPAPATIAVNDGRRGVPVDSLPRRVTPPLTRMRRASDWRVQHLLRIVHSIEARIVAIRIRRVNVRSRVLPIAATLALAGADPCVAMAEFTFGPFCLDTAASRLTRDGADVRLRPLAYRTLRVLLQHRGGFVDYDTMIVEAWEGTHVSSHTVDVTISEVRRHLGEYGRWIVHRPKFGHALEIPRSDGLVQQGWHFWSQRTRTGCERAIDSFTRAIAESPSDFRAHEGLSASYLTLAIFGMRCPLEMYPRFLEAHERAAASGLRPELRCNRAFALYVFEQRRAESEAEFLHTLSDKPLLGSTYVRLGLLYGAQRRFDEALAILCRGRQVDPLLSTLAAAEVRVLCWQREFERAAALGRQSVEVHPYLQMLRVNYAQALELCGRLEEALAQYQVASILSPDVPWLRALEGACQAMLGRRRDARAILERLELLRQSEYVDAYQMAVLHRALGQPREALAELARAAAENSAALYMLDVDPTLDALRTEPGFLRLRGRRCRAS
jgi:tetratricopeptide (TPR) repeat protein